MGCEGTGRIGRKTTQIGEACQLAFGQGEPFFQFGGGGQAGQGQVIETWSRHEAGEGQDKCRQGGGLAGLGQQLFGAFTDTKAVHDARGIGGNRSRKGAQ